MLILILSCLALGALVGFLAGLLGIGGGLIIVPVLVYLLPLFDVNTSVLMPMALATSLASIIITSSSAAFAHHKNGNIPWTLAKKMVITVAIGGFLGALIADHLSNAQLKSLFAFGVLLLATYMIFSNKIKSKATLPSSGVLSVLGAITGVIASLMGIAGGAILVPLLTYFSINIRHAMAVATVCGVALATFATFGFIVTGLQQELLPHYSLGYVYLPALAPIIISSYFFAKFGVKAAGVLPVSILKKMFAVFLIIVALKMMLT